MAHQRSSLNNGTLMDLHSGERDVPHRRRIFVNRNLKMQSIHALGFDMDHTLAVYRKLPMENLAFEATRDKLITEKHYDESIRNLRYDVQWIIRGLVVDKRRGNILKTDQYNYVVRLYHGTRLVPKDERRRLYRNRRIRLSSAKYMSIDTLFALPEATLYAMLVTHFDAQGKGRSVDYAAMYDDVRECIDRAHADGTLKRAILADPERFIYKHSELPETLAMFRDQGKRLFLLTNSEAEYTEPIMSYLLDGTLASAPRWTDFFDVVVVKAEKPGFFRSNKPLRRSLSRSLVRRAGPGRRPALFQGGGGRALEELLGFRGEEILYVGDHTFGDILRAKAHSRWRTAMVVEELEHEIDTERRLAQRYRRLDDLVLERNRILSEAGRIRRRLQILRRGGQEASTRSAGKPPGSTEARSEQVVDAVQRLQSRLVRLESDSTRLAAELRELREAIERRYNKHWGKLFKCGEINSRFAHQVKDFACIYTSAVRNFLAYPENMYFRSPREIMPHELGAERD